MKNNNEPLPIWIQTIEPLAKLLEGVVAGAVETAVQRQFEGLGFAPKPTLGLLTKKQCAEALGVSIASLDRYVAQGRVPFTQLGGRRRFDLAAVRAALAA